MINEWGTLQQQKSSNEIGQAVKIILLRRHILLVNIINYKTLEEFKYVKYLKLKFFQISYIIMKKEIELKRKCCW